MNPKIIASIKQMQNAAENGRWDEAVALASDLHKGRVANILDQLAYTEGGIPPSHLDQVIDLIKKHGHDKASIVYSISDNLHPETTPEQLRALFKLSDKDASVSQNIQNHPNIEGVVHPGQKHAAQFWNSYETSVKPSHFATIKSFMSGEPETINTHRNGSGSSEQYKDTIHHLFGHMQASQDAIMQDPDIKKHYINGVPHVEVYRGVGGAYAKAIKDAAGVEEHLQDWHFGNLASGKQKIPKIQRHKTLNIPSAHMSSWTVHRNMAERFAGARGDHDVENDSHHVVMKKLVPVTDILHSGMHNFFPGHQPVHTEEGEVVVAHPEGSYKIKTKDLHVGYKTPSFRDLNWHPLSKVKR